MMYHNFNAKKLFLTNTTPSFKLNMQAYIVYMQHTHIYVRSCVRAYVHAYIRTYVHTYIHTRGHQNLT